MILDTNKLPKKLCEHINGMELDKNKVYLFKVNMKEICIEDYYKLVNYMQEYLNNIGVSAIFVPDTYFDIYELEKKEEN